MKSETPMMAQYRELKSKNPDALLFFRLGDFYEMFYEDAEIGSRELGIALTGRDAGGKERAPMCGVPYHSVDDYIRILVEKGYRVAICEQLEDPSLAKGLVKRGITRVITPGTYWEGTAAQDTCYIASVYASGRDALGLAVCDLSTGDVMIAGVSPDDDLRGAGRSGSYGRLIEELSRFLPKECVLPDSPDHALVRQAITKALPGIFITGHPKDAFCLPSPGTSPDGEKKAPAEALTALQGLLDYMKTTQMVDLRHLKEPSLYLQEGFLEIDRSTRRNLELLQRLQGDTYGSLYWVLNQTRTAMGARLLRQWIERPLRDASRVLERLSAVDEFYEDAAKRLTARDILGNIKDLERLVTRLTYKSCNARDLTNLASSLEAVSRLRELLRTCSSELMRKNASAMDDIPEAVSAIRNTLVTEPPLSLTEGGLIREGFSPEIDELRQLASGGKQWVLDFEARERERTGIKSLRVGFNRVFGFYIEVTRSNLHMVPADYVRKQTLASAERFVTPELREKETAILGAEEKLRKEEYRIFCELRDSISAHIRRIQKTAKAVAEVDVLVSFAETAHSQGYVRPQVSDSGSIKIKGGRHPVLENVLPQGTFVPNDLVLDSSQRIMVITGPNMGGKSTYCRQAALIVIMAQMGCYVPCKEAAIRCVDKVFARVGAYDDLVLGQSTFMVEMAEVSRILKGATKDSLVILDEIGRGTSTFDGLSVAWAVLEHLADEKTCGAMALVATHYRELTLLSDLKPGIVNHHMAVKKAGNDIVFLRKLEKGVAEGSFGIDVAAMAGLPPAVVSRAREILVGLESEVRSRSRWKTGILGQIASRYVGIAPDVVPGQEPLFTMGQEEAPPEDPFLKEIVKEITDLELDSLTPREALNVLYDLKNKIRSRKET